MQLGWQKSFSSHCRDLIFWSDIGPIRFPACNTQKVSFDIGLVVIALVLYSHILRSRVCTVIFIVIIHVVGLINNGFNKRFKEFELASVLHLFPVYAD